MSAEAFHRLLAALDADPGRAAEAYERLRHRIIGLLQWWGATDAEDLADATLDRVARKLQDGAVVPEGSLGAYVRGVARMIFYESQRRPRVEAADLALVTPEPNGDASVLQHLDSCLDRLSPADRGIVLRYYADGKASEIRRGLATELGVSITALRIRAHRLRVQLERCVAGYTGDR